MNTGSATSSHPLDSGQSPFDGSPIELRPQWRLSHAPRFESDFGILSDRIVISRSIGDASGLSVAARIGILSKLITDLGLDRTGWVLVEDFEHLRSIDLDSRTVYIDHIRKLHGLRGIAFCHVSSLMRFIIRIGRTFNVTTFPVEVTGDLNAALRKALRWIGAPLEDTRVTPVDECGCPQCCDTVDDFIRILGSIEWDRPGAAPFEQVPPSSIWKPVADSMVLIKRDLDGLMARRAQRRSELQQRNAREKELQMKMAFAIEESRRNRLAVEEENRRREALVQDVIHSQKELLFSLGEIIESRSRETANHIRRVSEYSRLLGERMGLPARDCTCLLHASPMHDAGKISIPDAILNKPGKLTSEEFDRMKLHTVRGFELFRSSPHEILSAAAIIAHEHHEKWNGRGYPRGLAGENIHIFGRITALADVFDALGSDRCYKKAWPLGRILDLVKEERGQHFDPAVVDAFFSDTDGFLAIRERFPDVTA